MSRRFCIVKSCLPVFALAMPALLQGCATSGGQPEMVEARISPDSLRPGDEALITVNLKDKHQVVSGIEGVVQEDQRITFDLNDKGEQSDQKAGDGIWSFGVKVPFQAPEGQFLLELTAYREDGNPVSIKEKGGGVAALQKTVPLVIAADGATTPAPAAIEAAPAEPAAEAAPDAAVETDSQAGESPSEASDNAEASAAAEAPTAGDEPRRNAKSIQGGKAEEEAAPADDNAEDGKKKRKKQKKEDEAAEVEEAQPVEEAAPAGNTP